MTADRELITRFAQHRAENDFAELVRRHVNLVYSAALRQVGGDAQLAEDVSQSVFSDLSRKAATITGHPSLAGWLYTSARFAAAKIVRAEQRRRSREREFMAQPAESPPELDWEELQPVLDELMCRLNEEDREAVLLRYFQNCSYAEIAAHFDLNENTVRMRVERALERLRLLLRRRGITTTALLASLISTHAVQTAPASLAARLSLTALAPAAKSSFAFWQTLNAAKAKACLAAAAVAAVSAAFIGENRASAKLESENNQISSAIAQLQNQNAELNHSLATHQKNSLSPDAFRELLRLRGEAGVLRDQTNQIDRLRRQNRDLFADVALGLPPDGKLSAADQYTLRLTHAQQAITVIARAIKTYEDSHDGKYPNNTGDLIAAGALDSSNLCGLSADDFEIISDKEPDRFGNRTVAQLKEPITNAEATNWLIQVTGSLGENGFPSSSARNVWNPAYPPPYVRKN